MLCGCKYYRCCWKYPLFCPPIKCGATYYALIFSDEEVRYIRSCDMSFILGTRKSISKKEIVSATFPEQVFREKLFKGDIGCKDLPQVEKERIFEEYCTITNRILFLLEII